MNNVNKFKNGVNLQPTSNSTTAKGDIASDSSTGEIRMHDGTTERKVITDTATQTLTNKTLSGNTATNLVSGSGTLTLNTTGTVTVPNTTDTLVGKATTDTLTNKTISGNTATNLVSGSGTLTLNTSGTVTLPNATDTLVGKATTDTLTNKTLTTPVITNPTLSGSGGTLTLPAGPDTLVGRATTDTLTNKTLTSPVINTPTGIVKGDVGLGNVDNTSDATKNSAVATLTNKTIGDALSLTQVATPSSPSAGLNKVYTKSDDKLYTLNSAGVETAIGAGSGGINYISNPDAESATTGWATYADAAGNTPVDGTGGTATGLTFARSTSSPLRGAASFLITQANSTSLQGKGVSYDFTINSADQAKMLSISFDYNASSTFVASNGTTPPLNDGTTTTNAGNSDVEVFIYDVTNTKLIPVSPQVLTANGTNNFTYSGEFQTASNSTIYRLIFHCATTSANATGYSVKFDNVQVGPQAKLLGPPVTDWQTYSLTIGAVTSAPTKGTIVTDLAKWRRVGDSMEIEYSYSQSAGSGNAGNGIYLFPLPSGYTIDTTKTPVSSTTSNIYQGVGELRLNSTLSGGPYEAPGTMMAYDSTRLYARIEYNTSGTSPIFAFWDNATFHLSTAGVVQATFRAKVAIAGWSSTTTMSNDSDTRVVAAQYTGSDSATITTTYANLKYPTKALDTHAAYNSATGSFTVPVSGSYRVSGKFSDATTSGHNIFIAIARNGNAVSEVFRATDGSTITFSITDTIPCIAGDTISIQAKTATSTGTFGGVTILTPSISIERLSGPATIAASESVNGLYIGTPTTATLNTSYHPITFPTKSVDSHNSYSSGTLTIPISGKYSFSVQTPLNGTYTVNQNANISIFVNGVEAYTDDQLCMNASVSKIFSKLHIQSIPLKAGDLVTVQVLTQATSPSLSGSAVDSFFSWAKVGN